MTVGARKTTDSSEVASRAYSLVASTPQPFGRYVLIGKLGHGGMAEVNLAVADGKAGFRKLVVIKRLHSHLAMEPGFIDMFLDEARLAARLNHPHCVQTYEVGEWEGSHFLAMEYLDGQGLERLLRMANQHERSIPPELAARIVGDALDGLAYAHELTDFDGTPLGVVHRDVSPQNIFVTYNGMVKLLDFGIAKAATHVVETKTGVIKGKYAYIAPEQALGGDVDQRSDLWSMGVVLWEVLTGRRLFKSVNELATLHETIQGEIKLPSAFRDELPTDLDTICMRALQREPDERYQTAQEMKEDIDRYLLSLDRAPGRKSIARLMDEHFAEVVATHKQTLHRCLEGTGSAVSRSTIERLVEPSSGGTPTPSVSGIRASDGATPTPTPSPGWTPTPTPSPSVTPTPTPAPLGWNGSGGAPISADAASPPAAQTARERRGGGWIFKIGLVVLAVLLAGVAALLLPLGDDTEAPDAADVVASSRTTLPQRRDGLASPPGPDERAPDVALDPIEMGGPADRADDGVVGEAADPTLEPSDPETAPSRTESGAESNGAEPQEAESEGTEESDGTEAPDGRPARLSASRRARLRELRRQREAEREAQAAPPPDPRPAQEEARPAVAGPGYLTLATTPWTQVTVNGRDLGTTPLIRVELPAGAHVLHLENREQGIRETYRVTIRAGETVSRRLGLR